jgi:hypothetical protein
MAGEKSTARWVPLQHVYKAELQRFGGSLRPALQAACRQMKAHPYRYLDGAGVLHENDLSDDFFAHASFQPEESSAACRLIHVRSANGNRTVLPKEAYAIELQVSQQLLDTTENADMAAGSGKHTITEHDRLMVIILGLGDRVRPDMKPNEVRKIVGPKYKEKHQQPPPSQSSITRAFRAVHPKSKDAA